MTRGKSPTTKVGPQPNGSVASADDVEFDDETLTKDPGHERQKASSPASKLDAAAAAPKKSKNKIKQTLKQGFRSTRDLFASGSDGRKQSSRVLAGSAASDTQKSGSRKVNGSAAQKKKRKSGLLLDVRSADGTTSSHKPGSSSFVEESSHSIKAGLSDIEKLAQKSGTNTEHERFKVVPSYAYPKTKLNREELRQEMNKSSAYFHDLRDGGVASSDPYGDRSNCIGSLHMEVLQCFGIPRPDVIRETSAFCIAVCGSKAFKTDVMPPVANPMWLCKMRRACVFPLKDAFARTFVGVFGHHKTDSKDAFIGRVAINVARLRPGCTYDVTLPLRQYNLVYTKQQRGAIRLRFHLQWHKERRALLSYLPIKVKDQDALSEQRGLPFEFDRPKFQPHERVTIRCCDNRAFQNVARVVHGDDLPGKFSMKYVKATMREINFFRIHIMRYLRKQLIKELMEWRYPLISCFVFLAWMHSVYIGNIRFVPGHIVTYGLLQIWKNYSLYVMDGKHDNGFSAPTFEEMFQCLLYGNANEQFIEPLTMERKDPDDVESALQHFDNSGQSQKPSLTEIANSVRGGVKRSKPASSIFSYFNSSERTFLGTDAVDYMIAQGYAKTRQEAIELGRLLQTKLRLFEHVSRKYDFKDAEIYYVFLNFDTAEYVFKTHKPWFKKAFNFIGLQKSISDDEAHWEFPFATGKGHPRFTIKDSLVIRSKESRYMLEEMNRREEMDDMADLGVTAYQNKLEANKQLARIRGFDSSTRKDISRSDSISVSSLASVVDLGSIDFGSVDTDEDLLEGDDGSELGSLQIEEVGNVEVKILAKPPSQDIDFVQKQDKKISDQMAESRHKFHEMFGHVFNDRAYKLSLAGDSRRKESRIFSLRNGKTSYSRSNMVFNAQENPKRKIFKVPGRSKKEPSILQRLESMEDPEKERKVALSSRKDEYDRLLHLGKHSHSNVIISKIAVIVQPIVEMFQLGLSMIRALFNIFTWRDPFLTFWVVIFGTILVIVLHLFPWRLALGLAGIGVAGPQNWALRWYRERRGGGRLDNDMDTIVRKRKHRHDYEDTIEEFAYFTSDAQDNRPIRADMLEGSEYKEVAVPHTPLSYHRFYDWPPEPSYARVWTSNEPKSDHSTELALEGENFDTSARSHASSFADDDMSEMHSSGWLAQRRHKLVRGVKKRVKKASHIPKQLRSRRKHKLERLDEDSAMMSSEI